MHNADIYKLAEEAAISKEKLIEALDIISERCWNEPNHEDIFSKISREIHLAYLDFYNSAYDERGRLLISDRIYQNKCEVFYDFAYIATSIRNTRKYSEKG